MIYWTISYKFFYIDCIIRIPKDTTLKDDDEMAYTPLSAFSLDELKKEYEELYPKDKLEKNMDNRVLRPEEAKEYDDTIETMTYLLDQRYKSYKSFNGIMVKNIEKTPDRVEILLDVINEVDTTSEEGFEESFCRNCRT